MTILEEETESNTFIQASPFQNRGRLGVSKRSAVKTECIMVDKGAREYQEAILASRQCSKKIS